MPNSFIKKVQQYAFHEGLLKRDDKIIVGVSGGPDSISLTCVLDKLREKQNFQIKLIHINYHKRGEESNMDEKFVRDFAREKNLDLKVFDYKKGESKNIEEDMRNFRYRIFEDIREKEGFERIAIGHTKDDGVETFLMNFIRGAGIEGVISLKSQRGSIIRPLICCEKNEILDFLKTIKQDFCTDMSNFDTRFSRNKIRNNLIPLLEEEYNKNIKDHVIELVGHLRGDLGLIEDLVEKVYNEKVTIDEGAVIVNLNDLLEMPVALQKRIFRKIISNIVGSTRDISSANFFEFKKLVKSEKSKVSEMLIRNLKIIKKGNKIYFNLTNNE